MPRANTNGPEGQRKTKNVTLDADVQVALNEVQERLTAKLGFRPNLSQTVQYLIRNSEV